MKDVHPYPQDITADPFLVFGGLLSRKVVAKALEAISPARPTVFTDLVSLSDHCSAEHALQKGIEDCFRRNGIECTENKGTPRWDRLVGSSFGVEIKLDTHKFDPQFWNGSKEGENAVEQTRGYLDLDKKRPWAILTNGKVIRLMHRDSAFNFLDLWICDSDKKGGTRQAALIERAIKEPTFLNGLLEETHEERKRFNTSFEGKVQEFWSKHQSRTDRDWNVALVETVLLTAFYRYLEDCGVLPVFEPDYQDFKLENPPTVDHLLACLEELRKQTFLTKERAPTLDSLVSKQTTDRVRSVLSKKELHFDFSSLFWDSKGPVDLSDLGIAFFGDAYQLFANKTDINGVDGQYFTGSELAREAALYFVEDEKRGVSADEIIYDPFVGSGQLLRALVPFFHVLIQGEHREPSVISGMRTLVQRFAGTDIDENACWLARLSLTIATSERGKPLLDFRESIKKADVFETCFGHTESLWQEKLGIKGKIRAIVTNPPWRRLRQTTNELYSIETGEQAPLKKNKKNWKRYQQWLDDGGRERARLKGNDLKEISAKHRETFKRAGQREVNVSVSGLDFVDRIKGVNGKKWVIFLPDVFFIGQNSLRKQKDLVVRRYYSYPHNDHFKGTDSVMKFGVVFGGGSPSKTLQCHPMGKGRVDVRSVFERLGVLPIFGSTAEALAQSIWFQKAEKTSRWRRGEFDETEEPKRGAYEDPKGVSVRSAKKCNHRQTHSCVMNKDSISRWKGWNGVVTGPRVAVRDNRSNTRTQKILWAGVHVPGEAGVPLSCALSNAWNYLPGTSKETRALTALLNSPLADLAMRSIGSKRHINPKDLNNLGLPPLSQQVVDLLNKADEFTDAAAVTLLAVFELSNADAEKILSTCEWISKAERVEILRKMSLDVKTEAESLQRTPVKKRRAQVKRAAKLMGRR